MGEQRSDYQEFFGKHVGFTAKCIRDRLRHELGRAGHKLSAEQAIVLVNLWHHDGSNQQMISDFLGRDKTSTTRWLDVLEKRNLVLRVTSKEDRRQNMIYATNEGKQLCESLLVVFQKIHDTALNGIDSEEVAICQDVLRRVRENMGE